jgi:hypothetical protein
LLPLPLLPGLLMLALVLLLLLVVRQQEGCWAPTRHHHCSNTIREHSTAPHSTIMSSAL